MLSLQSLLLIAALSSTGQVELLEFTATWCGPCQAMQPAIKQVESAGFKVHAIDIDRSPELAARFHVTQVPTFVVVAGGKPVDRVVGAVTAEQLLAMLGRPGASLGPRAAPSSARAAAQASSSSASGARSAVTGAMPEQTALQATVRIHVQDPSGRSFGTGTIVDAHGREALVVTCAHLFRESNGRGQITVESFAPGATSPMPGQLIRYDLDRDVAFIAVRTNVDLKPVPVAGETFDLASSDSVFSVGCNHGQDPTVMRGRVLALNRYLGPENIVASGRPVDGRSGGGLFSADGHLVGVCNAADPEANEGLYAAYRSVHRALDDAKLSFVYRGRSPASRAVASNHPESLRRELNVSQDAAVRPVGQESLAMQALDEDDAEVVCIVRSRTRPSDPSRVYVLDRPSREFMARLNHEHRDQSNRQLTGMRVEARPLPSSASTAPSAVPRTSSR